MEIDSLTRRFGDVAQLEERLLCKQEVVGSNPIVSTDLRCSEPFVDIVPRYGCGGLSS